MNLDTYWGKGVLTHGYVPVPKGYIEIYMYSNKNMTTKVANKPSAHTNVIFTYNIITTVSYTMYHLQMTAL